MYETNGLPKFCAPGCHDVEFMDYSNREVLYQCKVCPWFEFQYQECDGL